MRTGALVHRLAIRIAIVAALAATLLAIARLRYGSLGAFASRLANDPISCEVRAIAGSAEAQLIIANHSDAAVEILGISRFCNCTVVESARRTISPGASARWAVRSDRPFACDGTSEIRVFTDLPGFRELDVRF
jgi:hypothetical protein